MRYCEAGCKATGSSSALQARPTGLYFYAMRFLLCLLLLTGLVSSLLLGGLFWATPYATVAAGVRAPNFSATLVAPPLVLSPARYAGLRYGLGAVAAGCVLGLAGLGRQARRPAMRRLRAEGQRGWRRLRAGWQQLSPGQRRLALGLGLLALALRGWLWVALPITDDELTSYDYYVSPGLALTASNYSLPNNHLLHNLLVGALGHLLPLPPNLLQRLPAVGSSAVLLPLSYLLLLRYLRFGAATVALGLFAFAPLPLFYSIAGRGYALQLVAAVLGSFEVLELLRPGGLRRLPVAVVVLGSVAGLYAVPTHAWVVLAWGAVLLVAGATAPRRLRGPLLSRLALAAASIAGLTGLLYLPVLLVSGPAALLHNPYVQPGLSWSAFAASLHAYLLEVVSRLWGHGRYVLPLLGALLGLAPLALARLRNWPQRHLGWLSWALCLAPLLALGARQQLAPPRTLLVVLLFSYVLVVLLARYALGRVPGRWRQVPAWARLLAVGGVVAVPGAWHLLPEYRSWQHDWARYRALTTEYAWLQARHPQQVWFNEGSRAFQGIYMHHLALLHGAPLPLALADTLPARARRSAHEYAFFNRQAGGAVPPALAAQAPAYADAYICVWQLPYSKL